MEKKVLVLGAGVSGVEASQMLLKVGYVPVLFDQDVSKDTDKLSSDIGDAVEFVLGELPDEKALECEFAVISPGISLETLFVVRLKELGVKVISEIELGYLYEKGSVIGITGTNGKTTTTTLVGNIMKAFVGQDKSFTVGNIGLPYTQEVLKSDPGTVSVIELSSFQLETIDTFHPHVSAILNITPDHLNRHHTMEEYARVKEDIIKNADEKDFIILNYNDPYLRPFGESGLKPKVIWFSGTEALKDGYFLRGDELIFAVNGQEELILKTSEVNLVGQCNYENILAAIAMTDAFGVPRDISLKVTRDFKAVPHRIEYVREVNGVRFYNDSKGTNPDAAIQAVKAMTRKTILIGGGYDKGGEFDDWILSFGDRIRKLLLLGQTKERIAACCDKYGFKDYEFVNSLEEAVFTAASEALPGEAVLLSPACASWGMFKNFEERGDMFKDLVNALV